jgi:hypothetical protein
MAETMISGLSVSGGMGVVYKAEDLLDFANLTPFSASATGAVKRTRPITISPTWSARPRHPLPPTLPLIPESFMTLISLKPR